MKVHLGCLYLSPHGAYLLYQNWKFKEIAV